MLTDYEVVTLVGVASSAEEGLPPELRTVDAPEGKVILSASGYYYPDCENAPTDLAQAYDNKPVFITISSDGSSAELLSAPITSAQYPSNAVVQLVCARIVND